MMQGLVSGCCSATEEADRCMAFDSFDEVWCPLYYLMVYVSIGDPKGIFR